MKRLFILLICILSLNAGAFSQCIADYTFTTTPNSLTVNFTDQSTFPLGTGHFWDFSDGFATSSQRNPSHTFSQPGTYIVYLTISNSSNCFDSTSYYVTVPGSIPPCSVNYSYQVNLVGNSSIVNFTNLSTGLSPTARFLVDFGNGDTTSFFAADSLNWRGVYAPGNYIATLNLIDTAYSNSCSYSDSVMVPIPPCTASFSYQTNFIGTNSLVSFTNGSSGFSDSTIFTVNLGNGDTISFRAIDSLNWRRLYAPGKYDVGLTLDDPLFGNQCFVMDSVVVPLRPCTADFSFSTSQEGSNTRVDFINLSSNFTSNSVFTYRFGDGDTASIPASNPNLDTQKVYSPGTYIVTLEIQDISLSLFCSKSDTIIIPNRANCQADFSYQSIGDTVYFTNLAQNYTHLKYFFGDGDSSSLPNPLHTYAQSNSYTVTQIVIDSLLGCRDSAIQIINVTISNSCIANFIPALDTSKKELLYLINQSSDLNSHQYFWDFGDGNTASGKTPIHHFTDFGAYPICLTVSDPVLNCMNHFCDTIGLDSNSRVIRKSGGFTLQVLDGGSIGIEERHIMEEIRVYPNPVVQRLNIELPLDMEHVRFRLYSFEGKLLREGKVEPSNPYLEFDQFKQGVYLLTLSFQNHLKKIKVLKME